jgi:hypothetical protein
VAAPRLQQLAPARVEEGAAGVDPLPPYDLRHAFASLQIRAGMSFPELAEQLGHSPQMTVMTYTHVIRELKGSLEYLPRSRSTELGAKLVDPMWTLRRVHRARRRTGFGRKMPAYREIAPPGFEPGTSRL